VIKQSTDLFISKDRDSNPNPNNSPVKEKVLMKKPRIPSDDYVLSENDEDLIRHEVNPSIIENSRRKR
jgi:hypothetical protein